MKTLILIALIAFIYCDDLGIDSDVYFVCPDDKIQLKDDICSIIQDTKVATITTPNKDDDITNLRIDWHNSGSNNYGNNIRINTESKESYVYIKKKCGKNKRCTEFGDDYAYWEVKNGEQQTVYQTGSTTAVDHYETPVTRVTQSFLKCLNTKVTLRKEGKKCAYHSECLTGYCSNKECKTVEKCINSDQCGKGKYCDIDEKDDNKPDDGITGTCKNKVTSSGSKCDATKNTNECCANGLYLVPVYPFTNPTTYQCIKPFSIEVGDYCYYSDELCKSGICKDVKASDGTYSNQCVSLSNFESTTCTVKCKDKAGTEFDCYDGDYNYYEDKDGKKVCIVSKDRNDLLEDIRDRYDKIKIDKLNDKEDQNYPYYETYGDKKLAELYGVYKYYPYLLNQGLIKSNGKRNGDKKCEYEFWKSTLSSSYVNVYLGFILALLGLLF